MYKPSKNNNNKSLIKNIKNGFNNQIENLGLSKQTQQLAQKQIKRMVTAALKDTVPEFYEAGDKLVKDIKQNKKQRKEERRSRAEMPIRANSLVINNAISCRNDYIDLINHPGTIRPTCLPRPDCTSSFRCAWQSVNTFSTGTGGSGFSVCAPCLANDQFCISRTGATYASTGTVNTYSAGAVTGVTSLYNGGLFSLASLTDGADTVDANSGRVVGVAVEVLNTTTLLYQQGTVYIGDTLNHNTIEGLTTTAMMNNPNTLKIPMVNLSTKSMFFMPYDIHHTDHDSTEQSMAVADSDDDVLFCFPWSEGIASSSAGTKGSPSLFVIVVGANTTNLATFTVKWTFYCEYAGPLVRSFQTPQASNRNDMNDIESIYNGYRQSLIENNNY